MPTIGRQSEKLLLHTVAAHYGLGAVRSYQRFTKGYINESWMVVTPRGRFVVRRCQRTAASLEFEVKLLDHLRSLPVPHVVRARSGRAINHFLGRPCVVFRYIPGDHPRVPSQALLRQLGGLLGRIHRSGSTFTFRANREPITHISTPKKIKWFDRKIYPKLPRDIRRQYPRVRSALQSVRLPARLPSGPIQLDPKSNNMLVRGHKLVGLVDFDFAHIGPYILDIGKVLQRQCVRKGTVIHARMNAFLAGYERYRPLTTRERSALRQGLIQAVAHHLFLIYYYYANSTLSLRVTRNLQRSFFPIISRYYYSNL